MPNQSGKVYGLTILSPIIDDDQATPSHDLQIRKYLADLPTDERSPFALGRRASGNLDAPVTNVNMRTVEIEHVGGKTELHSQ